MEAWVQTHIKSYLWLTKKCMAVSASCLLVCLMSQQHAHVSQGRMCSDSCTCCHTEVEVADQTFYLTQSQYIDTGPTNPSANLTTPGAWQGNHWNTNFYVTGMIMHICVVVCFAWLLLTDVISQLTLDLGVTDRSVWRVGVGSGVGGLATLLDYNVRCVDFLGCCLVVPYTYDGCVCVKYETVCRWRWRFSVFVQCKQYT